MPKADDPTSPRSDRPPRPAGGRMATELALVTGSTSGIGRAIALEFAAEGARVVIHGRDAERGRAAVEEARAAGGEAHFVAADLARDGAAEALVADAVARLGGLTVLVNNAVGVSAGQDAAVAEMSNEYWEAALRVNLTAPMVLCRAAIPHMRTAGHGSIVNVSSRQAERPSAGMAAYCASKGGLNALTRALAVEYGKEGIRANTLSPGYVVNDRRDADITPERRARYEAMHLTRLGTARDCAYAAVYLASHESEFLTGINLQLDGGSSIGRAAVLG